MSEETEPLKKRTWFYHLKPHVYEIRCDKCNGINLDWSEWKGMIWCYECKIDTKGTDGVFGGPIPIGLSEALGMTFHIYHMRLKRILYFHPDENKYWSHPPKDK